jgi:hypothetical protein
MTKIKKTIPSGGMNEETLEAEQIKKHCNKNRLRLEKADDLGRAWIILQLSKKERFCFYLIVKMKPKLVTTVGG